METIANGRESLQIIGLKKVSENGVLGFDIFVDVGTNLSRNAFYIKKRKRKLVMKAYYWDMPHFFTECFCQ
jgi:hypothetical protein